MVTPAAPVQQDRRLTSISLAAEYVHVHPKTIRRWIAQGRVTGYRVGPRLIRVNLNELDAMLDTSDRMRGGAGA